MVTQNAQNNNMEFPPLEQNQSKWIRWKPLDEGKRALFTVALGAIVAATASGTASMAEELLVGAIPPVKTDVINIPYRESELGINYYDLAPSPLAEMLSQGEAEWLLNATAKYGNKAGPFWVRSISKKLATGAPSESIIEKIRAFTPEMLRSFSQIDHRDPKYGRLSAEGSLFISEQFATNT